MFLPRDGILCGMRQGRCVRSHKNDTFVGPGRRVLVRDPEQRISEEEFFAHEWLDLDAYQGSIIIGPDDEEEGMRILLASHFSV